MIRRTPRSTRTDKLFPYTNALPIWQEDQLRRLTHSFSNRPRVSTFREFRTAEKAAELAPAFNHVAHAPVRLARPEPRGAIKQCRLPRRLASSPLPHAVSGLFNFPVLEVVLPCPADSPGSLRVP